MSAITSDHFVREFADTLPRAYREAFASEEIRAHAEVARTRGRAAATVGRFRARQRHDAAAIVVVAEDRPGLLALIAAALVLNDLDVTHGVAYTRKTPAGQLEAVDVFWVHAAGSSDDLSDSKIGALAGTLGQLIEGGLDPAVAVSRAGSRPAGAPPQETCVRLIEGTDGQLSVLEVETFDRSGLLLSLARALHQQRVQITHSEVHTEGARVRDRFTLAETDGRPIRPDRRLAIQVAVLSALEAVPAPAPGR